jgi:hypothetical protein
MRELEGFPDTTARTVIQWIREDWTILMQRLEGWIETH